MQVTRFAASTVGWCALLLSTGTLRAQARATADSAAEAIRVFLDCNAFCDTEFIKREITYVNWVRDRADADVHLIITSQSTGGGGQEFTLRYLGLRGFRGADDEIKFSTRQSDTDDEVRKQQARGIGLGLVRYLAKGPLADQLQLSYTATTASAPQKPHDPWNLWVFRIGVNSFFEGQSQNKSSHLNGNVRATRVAEDWKFSVSAGANRSSSSYTLNDSSVYKSHNNQYNANSLIVRSLGNHWSLGLAGSALRSSHDNYDLNVSVTPEVEFDVFPYKESSKRQWVFVYAAGITHADYRDTTIYNKLQETRPTHSLTTSVQAVQPWGSLSGSIGFTSFLDDFAKNRISLRGGCDIRLVRGLNVNFFAMYSRVRDQLSLFKEGATDQEILLQLKQLKTAYFYFAQVGISYTFGSKFNNIVNPRFGGSGCECFGGSCFCN